MESENKLLKEMNEKLKILIGLTAIQGKERDDQIKILAGLEYTNVDISKITGIPKGTVDGTRAKIKKEKGSTGK